MTKEELAAKLEAYGIVGLAEEVRSSDVSITDSAHFVIYDKEEEEARGEEGYGNYYHITTEELDDGKVRTAVYGRLVEPEGGTEWMDRNPEYYEIPEGVPEVYESDEYLEDRSAIEMSDAVDADSEYDRDFVEGREEDSDDWIEDEDSGDNVDIG